MSYDKSRRGFRGPKKRQAVVRAEIVLRDEARREKVCRALAEQYDLNLEEFHGEGGRRFWHETYQNIKDRFLTVDGVVYLGPVLAVK